MRRITGCGILAACSLLALVAGQARAQTVVHGAEVSAAVHFDVSPPLRAMAAAERRGPPTVVPLRPIPRPFAAQGSDPAMQSFAGALLAPSTLSNFDGVGQGFSGPAGTFTVNSAPPDANLAVGPNHIVQAVNTDFAIFSKTGTPLFGPVPVNTLWSGFGGGCQTNNDGDPLVQYDAMADRWVISQFSVSSTPYLQCVAVSQTADPTGAYNRYAFSYGNTEFNDYAKIGVWPDAYYATYNIFPNASFYGGAKICAFDRARMLQGQAATQQCFPNTSTSFGGILPADLDGPPPPAGSPNYLVGLGATSTTLAVWKAHIDWVTPANSTLTGPTTLTIPTYSEPSSGVPQAGTTTRLDTLSDRLMYRLAYRNLGDHESLVVNHSVVAGSSIGVRWYELRVAGGNPALFQAGTYAPDANYRWMGSIAMDQAGNMALGYSVSSASIKPQIHYTGRLAGDAAGTMTQGEGTIIDGPGAQTGFLTRWGDYTAMRVDPVDGCTFWYTNQYQPADGSFNWKTRIASFKFPSCGGSSLTTTSTALAASPNPSVYGQAVTFTATVTPSAATGTVQFLDGNTALGSAALSGGSASLAVSSLGAGSHSITAVYGGDTTYAGSTSPVATQFVSAAPSSTALASSPNPSTVGATVTFTAQVTPAGATGTVQFMEGATVLGAASVTGGSASLGLSSLSAGSHSITAVYGGDANYAGSTSPAVTQAVNCLSTSTALASSMNPSVLGQAVTFTATVTPGAATGTVQFLDNGILLGSAPLSAGVAAVSVVLGVGNHPITAVYSGDETYATSVSPALTQGVNPAVASTTTSLASSLEPSVFGTPVTFTATVTPSAATGTVQFLDGATALGTASLSGGAASITTASLGAGSHSITAVYSGDGSDAPSTSAALTQIVNQAPATVALGSSPNPSAAVQPVTFTATITPATATGSVQFFDDATLLGTAPVSAGAATLTTASLSNGNHRITAVYGGDANVAAGTSDVLRQLVRGRKQ